MRPVQKNIFDGYEFEGKTRHRQIYRFKAFEMEFIAKLAYKPRFLAVMENGRVYAYEKFGQNIIDRQGEFIGNLINKNTGETLGNRNLTGIRYFLELEDHHFIHP